MVGVNMFWSWIQYSSFDLHNKMCINPMNNALDNFLHSIWSCFPLIMDTKLSPFYYRDIQWCISGGCQYVLFGFGKPQNILSTDKPVGIYFRWQVYRVGYTEFNSNRH